MAGKPVLKAVLKRSWIDNDGKEHNRYTELGAVWENDGNGYDRGKPSYNMKLHAIPVGGHDGTITIKLYPFDEETK